MNFLKKSRVILFFVISILVLALGIMFFMTAGIIGNRIGEDRGKIVGKAIGSVNGVTRGIGDGVKDGEAAGLSAVDTKTEIKGISQLTGDLEVLKADVSITNFNQIGDAYAGLETIAGEAVFSVDLSEADILVDTTEQKVRIEIPAPTLQLFLDMNSTKTLAEMQHFSLSVSAEDGLNNYVNSIAATQEGAKDKISNYDSLEAMAKESAKAQVQQLASAIMGKEYSIIVDEVK